MCNKKVVAHSVVNSLLVLVEVHGHKPELVQGAYRVVTGSQEFPQVALISLQNITHVVALIGQKQLNHA